MEPLSATPPGMPGQNQRAMTAARALETTFLTEMLKSAGLGKTPSILGGGAGEDQFGSFLREEQARQMVDAGGIGLAQAIFESLRENSNDR